MRAVSRTSVGMTLIEVLLVLAILGILLAIAVPNLRPPALRLATDSAQAFVQQARFEAIRLNSPVAVTVTEGTLVTRSDTCSGEVLRGLPLNEFPQVSLSGADFFWSATGEPRNCTGGSLGLGGPRFSLSDDRNRMSVSVSGGGAVTTQ